MKSIYAILGIVLALAVAVNLSGYIFHWYQQFWWFDRVLHAYTSLAATLVVGVLFYRTVASRLDDRRGLLMLTVVLVGLAFGALWEIGEFWIARSGTPGGASRFDTVMDLIMDLIGATLAGWLTIKILFNPKWAGFNKS